MGPTKLDVKVQAFFTAPHLPPSPKCEHGSDRRWCNRPAAGAPGLGCCADIQWAEDCKAEGLSYPSREEAAALTAGLLLDALSVIKRRQ